MQSERIRARNRVIELPGSGSPIVYAHGFGCSQAMWRWITPAFAGQHRQVLFDYVGSGMADRAAFDPLRYATLDGYAQDLLDVCAASGITGGATLVAHSVSCSIGFLAARRQPQLFERMVLVGPNPCFLNDGAYRGGFERADLEELLAQMRLNYLGWASQLAPLVMGGGQPAALTAELEGSFCSTDPETAGVFAQATFFADNRGDLGHVPARCLILQHCEDVLAPLAVGDYLASHLPKAELQVLDVAGHCAHMSHPDLVVAAISRWLER